MGTPEPPEHWAPVESLDPTPVWRQYALVGLLLLGFIAIVAGYVAAALAPEIVTPPAVVPGSRVVLAVSDHPPGTTKRVELAGLDEPFYLVRSGDDGTAIRSTWAPDPYAARDCAVELLAGTARPDPRAIFRDSCTGSTFDAAGGIVSGTAPRGLDRYLVARKGDRLVVNLDRPMQGAAR